MFGCKKQKKNREETCLTCRHIVEDNKPILSIRRDKKNGEYQFFCGFDTHREEDIKIVTLEEMLKIDESIGNVLPLELDVELRKQYIEGKGLELKKFIQDGINHIIQEDSKQKKISMSQLYHNGEIVYYNGRNGTWFDWDMNGKSSWFTVCFNDKKRMGYISVALFKDGVVSGYKWGDYGQGEAESITLGKLNKEDTEYFLRLLLQQTDDKGIFDVSIDTIHWNAPVFLESLEGEKN